MLQEGWAAQERVYLDAGYRIHTRFPVEPRTGSRDARILFFADRTEVATRAPGLPVTYAFQYQEPRCGFTPAEQRVLTHAVDGQSDHEIATDLAVSANTVKQTWRSIYQRIDRVAPYVRPHEDQREGDRRGPEKRRHVVAFLEQHPEEMRPFQK